MCQTQIQTFEYPAKTKKQHNNNNRPPKRNGTKKYEQTSDGWLKKNVENTKIGWNKDKY